MYPVPVKLGEGGRIVIPSEMRKAMGVEIGDELLLCLEHGRLVLTTHAQSLQYVQEQMAQYTTGGRMLSDELIGERREQGRE